MNGLKQKEKELRDQMTKSRFSNYDLLGRFELPPTYKKLEELQINKQLSTLSIGFELWLARPITPAPLDLIQFAHTGGDGCYFAFITDFGNQSELENCPIAFISPTDFDQNNPRQSTFLIAKNIKEFLSLMISLKYAEHLRFQNIYNININKILAERINQFHSEKTIDEIKSQKSTIDKIVSEFGINKISNFYTHFECIKNSRNTNGHLVTLDGLNISYESKHSVNEINANTIFEYQTKLKLLNRESKLVAIRNAPIKFSYFNPNYYDFKKSLTTTFKELNLDREMRIQEYEIKMEKISNEWLKVRKQVLKDKR